MNADDHDTSDPRESDDPTAGSSERPIIIRSEDLLQGHREIWIEHGKEMYRLRLTANGKLYLTK